MNPAQFTIESRDGEYSRTTWLSPGPATSHCLCVFLDGEHYLESVEAHSLVQTLTQDDRIEPMTLLFLSHGGGEARHTDYVCDAKFARFIAEDVVRWARERVPSLSAEAHLICGMSLSGLAAAHVALLYPKLFPSALCQSGSFWWEPETFAALVRQRPPIGTRFWLSVGDEETEVDVSHPPTGLFQSISQIAGVEKARQALELAGGVVNFHGYEGGHTFAPWRAELDDALPWLLQTARRRHLQEEVAGP